MALLESDLDLLRRFRDDDDTVAFAALVRRHSSLVYHTCFRVLGHRERAEDAAQETFHRLMLQPDKVHYSVSAWLHRVATRLAIDVARSDSARQRREKVYQQRLDRRRAVSEPWAVISAQLDEAMMSMPEPERSLLIEHYLKGRPQSELAREQGMSKATMCRRMEAALQNLQGKMGRPSAARLATLIGVLGSYASAQAPKTLTVELDKMSMLSGTGAGALASSGAASTLPTWPIAVGCGAAAVGAMGLIFWATINQVGSDLAEPGLVAAATQLRAESANFEEDAEARLGTSELIYLDAPRDSLRSDLVVALRVEGESISLLFADGHVTTRTLQEGRVVVEKQTGQSLDRVVADAKQRRAGSVTTASMNR